MASWTRRRGRQVVFYYWNRETKAQDTVPRPETEHLDGLPDEAVERAFTEWEARAGVARVRSRRRTVIGADELAGLVTAFMDHCAAMSSAKRKTRETTRQHLESYVIKFFVEVHATPDVRRWWQFTPLFPMWLRTEYRTLRIKTVRKIVQSLRRFGEYLATHHVIPQPWLLATPRVRERPASPLVKELTTEGVLAAAEQLRAAGNHRGSLFLLLGFFATLRPEETYALEKEDFVTGERARKDARTHARFVAQKLGSGLSITITKVKTRDGDEPLAKSHYAHGVVNVWSIDGARAVAAIIRDLPSGPVWTEGRYAIDTMYRRDIQPLIGVSASDLRRASGLHLGRTVGLEPFLLQDHMRHSTLGTTLLYTRRPLTERESDKTQNFDDVG